MFRSNPHIPHTLLALLRRKRKFEIMRRTIPVAGLCVLALAASAEGIRVFVAEVPAPAMLAIGIKYLHGGNAAITYKTAGGPVGAFALDINVSAGAVITAISGYEGTLDILPPMDINDPCWMDPNYVLPVPGPELRRVDGLGTGAVTAEFAALNTANAPNAPPPSGTLCNFTISGDGIVFIRITANTARGVFSEETSNVFTNLPFRGMVVIVSTDCYPSNSPHYDAWAAAGKPACWCYPTQCRGDANGDSQVNTLDFNLFRQGYFKTGAAYLANVCADFNNDGRIDNADFFRLRDNYAKVPAADCPPP